MSMILATKMDHEDKDYTLEMLERRQEGYVPKDLEEQGLYARRGCLCLDYSVRRNQAHSLLFEHSQRQPNQISTEIAFLKS